MTRILAISGSYRAGGSTEQLFDACISACRERGASVDVVHLRDHNIRFCSNCRACTQAAGEQPGTCIITDDAPGLIERIQAADGLILASPVNFGTITALMKCFMERLVCYAYWPWGQAIPKMRRKHTDKRAILITTSAAPGPLARIAFGAVRTLKLFASTVGARPVGILSAGMLAAEGGSARRRQLQRAKRLAERLTR